MATDRYYNAFTKEYYDARDRATIAAQQKLLNQGIAGQLGAIGQGLGQAGLAQGPRKISDFPNTTCAGEVEFKRKPEGIREELQEEINDWLSDV